MLNYHYTNPRTGRCRSHSFGTFSQGVYAMESAKQVLAHAHTMLSFVRKHHPELRRRAEAIYCEALDWAWLAQREHAKATRWGLAVIAKKEPLGSWAEIGNPQG
jgi:hypothetical protein